MRRAYPLWNSPERDSHTQPMKTELPTIKGFMATAAQRSEALGKTSSFNNTWIQTS